MGGLFLLNKVVKLVGGVSVINRAYPVKFNESLANNIIAVLGSPVDDIDTPTN